MKRTFDDLPGWTFEVIETTPGGYTVYGMGPHGLEVSFQGNEPEALLERARDAATEVTAAREGTSTPGAAAPTGKPWTAGRIKV